MSVTTKSIIAVSAAAFLALIGIVSTAEAGRGGGARMGGGGIHMGGSAKFHTNQGGKYGYRGGGGGAKFHTNQGLKYGYRGSGGKFHTNQGGKYRGWSGKFDNDRHHGKYGHYRRYGYPWYGLPLYIRRRMWPARCRGARVTIGGTAAISAPGVLLTRRSSSSASAWRSVANAASRSPAIAHGLYPNPSSNVGLVPVTGHILREM
jgi:hypothetical protein